MTLVDRLLRVASAYTSSRGLSESTVSKHVFGDGQVLSRLRQGRDLTTSRFEAGMQWFSDNWPEDAVWPADVPRPAPSQPVPREAAE